MNQAMIERLADVDGELCISIIFPTTRLPDRKVENEIRLNNLVSEAKKSIIGKVDRIPSQIDNELNKNVKNLPEKDLNSSVAIFVSDSISECITLPIAVDEKVAVKDKFRLNELFEARNESTSYYLLVLSESKARLYKGNNEKLEELDRFFPLEHSVAESSIERIESSKPAPRWLGSSSGKRDLKGDASISSGTYVPNMDSINAERLKQFFREVDTELSKRIRIEPRPVFLVTVEQNASVFNQVSSNNSSIVRNLYGSMDNASDDELRRLVQPSLRQYKKDIKRCYLKELEDSRNRGLSVSGIDKSFKYLRQGRGKILLIEKNYQKRPEEEIEELLRYALRSSCEVYFVDSGDLRAFKSLALILRY